MAAPPPSLLIHRLIDGDPINPGLESRFATKAAQSAVDLQESFLRRIARLFGIAQQPKAERIYRPFKLSHQLFESSQLSSAQPGDQPSLRTMLDRSRIELEPGEGGLVQCGHVSG